MSKKILIIDDSALMRRVISDIIKLRSEYEIAGIARDGLDGFEKITKNPDGYDAVIMDINMPKMNGLEVLENLSRFHVKHKTIVVSTLAVEGAKETIRALELGAFDFVTKPTAYSEVTGNEFKEQILSKLDVACGLESSGEQKRAVRTPVRRFERKTMGKDGSAVQKQKSSKLVALACSTGGPKSLQSVIPKLPAQMDAPMVLVQHMPKGFTLSLAQRLNEISKVKVSEAVDGEILEKGHVYIAPGGRHMEVAKASAGSYRIQLSDAPPIDALRPCANVMYDSLIHTDFDEITCVVLTGMGADGTRGITNLAAKKNVHVIAQDEKTCVVYGMPKAIAESGLVDEVKPLDEIADAIIKNVGVS
ncbi:MAG: chemotaxis response regulator protein-glutamate methylesterase [Thermoflexaceae bacterium]|nr:chemotaxis response regulator protein-glutamate methylesterase [Thermoflexaceae bacterium]